MVEGIGSRDHRRDRRPFVLEHLEFLGLLPPDLSSNEHPFGFEHQSLLRVVVTALDPSGADLDEIVRRYWRDPEQRRSLRKQAEATLVRQVGQHPDPAMLPDDAVRFLDTETCRRPFAQRIAPAGSVVLDCDYGYAEFMGTELQMTVSGLPYLWAPMAERATVGAMMFYGSAPDPTCPPLVQELPVRLIAATARSFVAGPIPDVRNDWTVAGMVADLRDSSAIDIDDTFIDMFVRHEHGHRASASSRAHARLAAAAGVPLDEAVTCAFPDRHHRGSWSRLVQGVGSSSDAIYLLGDLVANLRALELAGADSSWNLIRAFNWRFVGSDGPIRLPRGNAVLLVQRDQVDASEHAQEWAAEVLQAVAARPAQGAEILVEAERNSWAALAAEHR